MLTDLKVSANIKLYKDGSYVMSINNQQRFEVIDTTLESIKERIVNSNISSAESAERAIEQVFEILEIERQANRPMSLGR